MKKILLSALVASLIFSSAAYAGFMDVDVDHGFFDSIDWLQKNGVVQGYEDGSFRPTQNINRAEFLKMLYKAEGEILNDSRDVEINLPFPDVPDDEWYTIYVQLAYDAGIVDGYPDGTFKPANPINVVEALKIVDNMFFDVDRLYDPLEYTACYDDIDLDDIGENDQWYWKYLVLADDMCLIAKEMMVDENGNLKMKPWHDLTRGQMAELIFRAKALNDTYPDALEEYRDPLVPIDLLEENQFNSDMAAPGVRIMGLEMVEVKPAIAQEYDYENYSDWDIQVLFDGEVIVSGDYTYYDPSDPILGEMVCIDLDAESSEKVPRVVTDDGDSVRICLENMDVAGPEYEPVGSTGTTTVKIENYTYRFAEASVYSSGDLVQVYSK